MLDEPLYSENPKFKIRGKEFKNTIRGISKARVPKLLSCHFCANTWDSAGHHFVCPKCHTAFNPKLGGAGFGGEVKVARYKAGISQAALAKIVGCSLSTQCDIESNRTVAESTKSKMIRERLRVWIESTRSPIDRRKEIDEMFNEKEK